MSNYLKENLPSKINQECVKLMTSNKITNYLSFEKMFEESFNEINNKLNIKEETNIDTRFR